MGRAPTPAPIGGEGDEEGPGASDERLREVQ